MPLKGSCEGKYNWITILQEISDTLKTWKSEGRTGQNFSFNDNISLRLHITPRHGKTSLTDAWRVAGVQIRILEY